jgi:hypothetical protein
MITKNDIIIINADMKNEACSVITYQIKTIDDFEDTIIISMDKDTGKMLIESKALEAMDFPRDVERDLILAIIDSAMEWNNKPLN